MEKVASKLADRKSLSYDDARAIARDAYIYGFPLVDSYRIQFSYFIDESGPEYKGPWNQIHNTGRVYTPADKAVQTPNSDTPYSMLGADLREEPLVLTMPDVEEVRYYSAQFIDAYTFNFAYVGSRTTGNKRGSYLLAGPRWQGEKPEGIKEVIRAETDLVLVIYRTQLYSANDLESVKQIQVGYTVQPLSGFMGSKLPETSSRIDFIKPINPARDRKSLEFFKILNFLLQFCPIHASEKDMIDRFAALGIGNEGTFDPQSLPSEIRKAIEDGITDAWNAYEERKHEVTTGKLSVGHLFGSRELLKNDYLTRMVAAAGGIYGNSVEEAWYKTYYIDSAGQTLDTTENRYMLRFAPGKLPPVKAFWSVTLYEFPSQLLSENSLNRYLINSPMLPQLKFDPDGSLSIYIQHENPGADNETNWLPAPRGQIKIALRLYWPKPEVINGTWKAPPVIRQME